MRPRQHRRHAALDSIAPGVRPSVYIVGFDNGMVKVGATAIPCARLQSVTNRARRRFGCEASEVEVIADSRNWITERAVLQQIQGIAHMVEGREWFTGISFADALAIVRATIVSRACKGAFPAGLALAGSFSSPRTAMVSHQSITPVSLPFGVYPMGENEGACSCVEDA